MPIDLSRVSDADLAAALSALPVARLERVARLTADRLTLEGKLALQAALNAAPAAVGRSLGNAIERGLREALRAPPRSR